jgi:hypothetical protein
MPSVIKNLGHAVFARKNEFHNVLRKTRPNGAKKEFLLGHWSGEAVRSVSGHYTGTHTIMQANV